MPESNYKKLRKIYIFGIISILFILTIFTFNNIKVYIDKKEKIKVKMKGFIKNENKRIADIIADFTTDYLIKNIGINEIPIIIGIMNVESNFNPTLVSSKRARGLMQVRWSVWKEVLVENMDIENEFDLHEIDKGIEAGIFVLHHYLKKSDGDLKKALYFYSGKSKKYPSKVYEAVAKFTIYLNMNNTTNT